MNTISRNNFSAEEKYKIYRSVYDIIHPTISKKNISNYKVILEDKLLPVHVFYPKKVSNMTSAIIYVPGDGRVTGTYGKYTDICANMASKLNKLLVAVDYFGGTLKYPTTVNKVYRTIKYLIDNFVSNGISYENIYLVADSVSSSILIETILKFIGKDTDISRVKVLLLYPVVRNDYSGYEFDELCLKMNEGVEVKVNNYLKRFYAKRLASNLLNIEINSYFPYTYIITGDMDIFKDDGKLLYERLMKLKVNAGYANIKFAGHGFLGTNDQDILDDIYKEIKIFVGEDEKDGKEEN